MKRIELLAPAGSFEALKAAISNGADAVYLGGKNFGARAYATNFNHEEMIEAINFAHLYCVKVYVTMNTLLNDLELTAALKEVAFYLEIGVDALIIQDLGLYYEIKKQYPLMEIHCSTQMHIHNVEGVKTAKALGFKRVVVARESKLEDIKEMCQQGIEIETFVHGALCISYSGQCLFSSSLFNRSGNKGICAQCCRLPYKLFDIDSNEYIDTNDYLLSSHDMMLINNIPELIEAGVSSLKIEGRMKKPAYVGYITRMYRKAINAYYSGKDFNLSEKELENIKVLFNRGFTNDYLFDAEAKDIYASDKPNHRGITIGKVIAVKNSKAYVKLEKDLAQFDGIRFNNNDNDGFIVNRLYETNGSLTSFVKAGDTAVLDINSFITRGTLVYKTSDFHLEKEIIENLTYPRLNLDIDFVAHAKEEISLSCKCDGKEVSVKGTIVEEAKTSAIKKEDVLKAIDHLKDTPYRLINFNCDLDDNCFISIKEIKELRRSLINKLNQERLVKEREEIKPSYQIKKTKAINLPIIETNQIMENVITISEKGNDYLLYPVINPLSIYQERDKIVVSELGALLKEVPHKIAYYTLNANNSSAVELLFNLGFEAVIISSELRNKERDILANALKDKGLKAHYMAYGKRDLMNLRLSPIDAIDGIDKNHHYALSFKEHLYPIVKRNNRTCLVEDIPLKEEDNQLYRFEKYD